jgi:hypothetical protein
MAMTLLTLSLAHAADINLGAAQFAGDCPLDSELVVNEGGVGLQLSGVVSQTGAQSLSRKRCTMAVPFTVPAGTQIAIQATQVSVNARLGRGNRGTVNLEAFLAGPGSSLTLSKQFKQRQVLRGDLIATEDELKWTECGGQGLLRFNASSTLQGRRAATLAISAVNIALAVRPCQQ